eukprot:CAMPEP_0197659924 /NCGR_PEP_ID=MMETSP1338-20131121/49738_1 /TAXON_ID=43686 ORGANISM="Pelagodinium beii, Strain RCC1491" /NCGR_SAMPLE_ID=MMETSP1338 /ASSEMBLY_ACC=CAM_ASM_000754 /LENGTH=48 /DNA_ID= /DNA_START= /DNA_END= /DNA_ORIENTATION=
MFTAITSTPSEEVKAQTSSPFVVLQMASGTVAISRGSATKVMALSPAG